MSSLRWSLGGVDSPEYADSTKVSSKAKLKGSQGTKIEKHTLHKILPDLEQLSCVFARAAMMSMSLELDRGLSFPSRLEL